MDNAQQQIESHHKRLEALQGVVNAAMTECALSYAEGVPAASGEVWGLLWKLSQCKFRAGMALAAANQLLAHRRMQVLLPKDKDITELDRTVTLEQGAADEQANVKRLELAYELLGERISLLASYAAYVDTGDKQGASNGEGQAGHQGDVEAVQAGPEENNV